MFYFNPLLCPDFIRAFNYLDVSPMADGVELWQAAQNLTLYIGSYCAEKSLPPEALASFFSVEQSCSNLQTVAFLAAHNVVEAYEAAWRGGEL